MRSRPRLRALLAAATTLVGLALTAAPAAAACHIASFVTSSLDVDEGAGTVTATIYLVGRQPSCSGTVDWETVDGTATSEQDFQASSGTVTFEAGDDREEAITVTLLDDRDAEGPETFTIELSNPTGGISSTSGMATVTIADDDGSGESSGGETGSEDTDDGGGAPIVPIVVALATIGGIAAAVVARRR